MGGMLATGWHRIAKRNCAIAATAIMEEYDWDDAALDGLLVDAPPPASGSTCLHHAYDSWLDRAIHDAIAVFHTVGRAQKFVNLYVKYCYCAEVSALGMAENRPGWTLEYACALHAPLDRIVLINLKKVLQRARIFNDFRALIEGPGGQYVRPFTQIDDYDDYRRIAALLGDLAFSTWNPENACVQDNPFTFERTEIPHVVQAIFDHSQGIAAFPLLSALDLEMRVLWE